MTGAKKGIVLSRAVLFAVLLCAAAANAEQSVLVYPSSTSIFRYDPIRYRILNAGDANFDAGFAIGNQMLWDQIENRIPVEVYHAPELLGFEPSASGTSEYVTLRNEFKVCVDGFGDSPHYLGNLYMRFIPVPSNANPVIEVAGQFISDLTYKIRDFDVSTPTGDGFYSDVYKYHVRWSGSIGLRILVFSDKNFNGVFDDGPPLFNVRAEDNAIPVQETTWGAVKALYDAE